MKKNPCVKRDVRKNQNKTFIFKSIIIAFALMCGLLKKSIGQTEVQTTIQIQMTTATTVAKAFASASTSGNLIVVGIDWDGQTRSVNSVNDNKGNTYARISGPTNWNGAGNRAELWYAYNITGGSLTVTATLSGAPTTYSEMGISEYSGITTFNPLDQSSVATGGGPGPAVNSGTKTTTYTNELIYGAAIVSSGTLTTGPGFTSRIATNNIEDKKAAVAGPNNAMFNKAGPGNWIATMVAFYTTSSIILPIDLLSFTGQCNNNNIVLSWATAAETNNAYFTVERSEDGANWNVIGTVKSNGNSSITQNYSFNTGESNSKVSYFRLRQTDLDGNFKYFSVIPVDNCGQDLTTISIYSNPTNGRSLFGRINQKDNAAYVIIIFDSFGKMVSRSESNQSEFTVNFPQILPSGVYYARFTSRNFSTAKCFLVTH
jgi:hypothetical protein